VFGYANGQLGSLPSGIDPSTNTDTAINVSLSPKYPGPQENTTVTVSSFQINLNSTVVSWYLNGEMKLSGIGKKNFTFTTELPGKVSVIKINVDSSEFGKITKEVRITPTDLDLLWEADTYTPPFYKGKALPASQSLVRVIPFPSFSGKDGYYNAKDLIYKWKKGYFSNPDDSGYGKNTFLYKTGYTFNNDEVQAIISTVNTGITVDKKISIYVSDPKIVFYENKPLGGIRYENAIPDPFTFTSNELVVHAVPYFFSLAGLNNNSASFAWKLDGKKLEINPDNKTEYTFGKPEKGNGKFQLNLEINNTGYELQSSSKNLSLTYSNQ
jgi:hypothetical protein